MPKKKESKTVEQAVLLPVSDSLNPRVLEVKEEDLERSKKMIQMMLRMHMDKEYAAVLIEMMLDLNVEQKRYLVGPVVVHRCSWTEVVPERLIWAAYEDRLNIIFEECKSGKVTGLAAPADMLAAMMPASMEAPMHHDWSELYFYLGADVMSRFGWAESAEAFYEQIGHRYPPTFDRVKQDYYHLSQDVRRKVANAAKERGVGVIKRQSKTKPKAEIAPRAEAQTPQREVVQASLNLFI